MPEFARLPPEHARDTVVALLHEQGPLRPYIYWLVLLMSSAVLIALPLIHVDVSVRAGGLVRPLTERSELRAAASGFIARVWVQDQEPVERGQPLLELRSRAWEEQRRYHRLLQEENGKRRHDLAQLAAWQPDGEAGEPAPWQTSTWEGEWRQFVAELAALRLQGERADRDARRIAELAGRGLVTARELEEARYEVERLARQRDVLIERQRAAWHARWQEARLEGEALAAEGLRLEEEGAGWVVRAPIDGTLVEFSGWAPGAYVALGQALGAISPRDGLRIELGVPSRDVGLVRVGQAATLQIEAFPYIYWGTLAGTVEAISDDYVASGLSPVFKVVVRPHATVLARPGGGRGELRKGMTCTARLLVARRSLWQWLYQDLSDWLDPQATASSAGFRGEGASPFAGLHRPLGLWREMLRITPNPKYDHDCISDDPRGILRVSE